MTKYIYLLAMVILASACGGGESDLEAKKEALSELKSQSVEIQAQIKGLEKEIAALDPSFLEATNNSVLVTAISVKPEPFRHMIEVRGGVESRTNVTVGSQIPGEIESVRVKEGDYVKSGHLLAVLDGDIIQNNIAELKTSLELATIVAQKQASLWEKNIGTEIQYLEAKNNKESLERKLATANSQLRQTRITAPFSGSIDAVIAKKGEMAQPGMPLIRIVNPNDIHINADISERYIGKFKVEDPVEIYFPSQDKKLISKIKSVGQVINSENRTFQVEVQLPKLDFPVKPNQVVVLKLEDYKNVKAFKVPTKLIQKDHKGSFVFGLEQDGEHLVATKIHIKAGLSFDNETEILSGVKLNQQIAFKGYRELSEGAIVKLMKEGAAEANASTAAK
ncbi:efflux RND transporter periplasmic adaptor subunit [Reichenbachiella carrageenanivorans]|uniref:Efflux RND transporter periplasmic adaptor subunit n=1 Tax=Reichenbachiella carrageenanivorans TaxID=2979869 RepID=A0ABY6D015_9BACT|nr:efflux RND transporter periplasmic adaptor subunit [Reichenbachiella carrageenanivorans]UXX79517.1 efflux RND transporter periplasmic adaptor subunit [Reichenbachiella carrageenanivorans]